MGSLILALVVAGGTFAAGLTFDVGVNALQNWYDVIYSDAFWTYRVTDSAALRQVTQEEVEIDHLMRGQDFVAQRGE
jgi:hypothetical protein